MTKAEALKSEGTLKGWSRRKKLGYLKGPKLSFSGVQMSLVNRDADKKVNIGIEVCHGLMER